MKAKMSKIASAFLLCSAAAATAAAELDTAKIDSMHYWGKGPAAALARGLKHAMDTQNR